MNTRHRQDCGCVICVGIQREPPCWNCGEPNHPPRRRWTQPRPTPRQDIFGATDGRSRGAQGTDNPDDQVDSSGMNDGDLKTWLMTFCTSIDVYVCAEAYLMEDFKSCISAYVIDCLEVVGLAAAHPDILYSCKTLYAGVRMNDPLLKKLFARAGFMLATMWRRYPDETSTFFVENAELGSLIVKETMERRETEAESSLPPMNPPNSQSPAVVLPIRRRRRI
jgi:hypothetical protein